MEWIVCGFVNEKIVGNFFFVDELLYYFNVRLCMNEDFYGSKCKRRVLVWVKLFVYFVVNVC